MHGAVTAELRSGELQSAELSGRENLIICCFAEVTKSPVYILTCILREGSNLTVIGKLPGVRHGDRSFT